MLRITWPAENRGLSRHLQEAITKAIREKYREGHRLACNMTHLSLIHPSAHRSSSLPASHGPVLSLFARCSVQTRTPRPRPPREPVCCILQCGSKNGGVYMLSKMVQSLIVLLPLCAGAIIRSDVRFDAPTRLYIFNGNRPKNA